MTPEDLRNQDINDIWALLQTKEGARFLSRLMGMTGVHEISYTQGDMNATLFKEGSRNVGLPIYANILEADHGAHEKLTVAKQERSVDFYA